MRILDSSYYDTGSDREMTLLGHTKEFCSADGSTRENCIKSIAHNMSLSNTIFFYDTPNSNALASSFTSGDIGINKASFL